MSNYKIFYTNEGKIDAINRISDGASLPFNPQLKTFDEADPLVVEMRKWEKTNSILDLSDRAPLKGENITSHPSVEEVVNKLQPGQLVYKNDSGELTGISAAKWSSDTISSHKFETNAHAIAQIDGLQESLSKKQALSQILSAIAALTSSGVLQIKSDGTTTTFIISDAAKTLLDDTDIPAIRTTLELGGAALLNVGNTANTVAAGNDPRLSDARSPKGSAGGDLVDSFPNPSLAATGITPGTYTNATITFDPKGRAIAASSGSTASGSGTVTSVALSLPTTVFSVSGSPVTSNGTLNATFKTQAPALVFASPSAGSAGVPAFRTLAETDIPPLTAAKISDLTSGTWADLPLSNGWTNPLLTMAASYIKLSVGLIMLRGQISKLSKPTSGEAIATLPVNFRPTSTRRFLSANNSNSSRPVLEINSNTGVISYADLGTIPSTIDGLILSPVIFYAG